MRTNIEMMLSPLTEKVREEQRRSLNPYAIYPAASVVLAIGLPIAIIAVAYIYEHIH